jgi:DNA polymerase-3 subunit gamma/tau
MCAAITEGHAMDLIEIDAASNRGIDEIRELREKVRYVPVEARHKVYVIDEVHMLTEPAFNALLKTLEEPPPRTIFVLATTEPHRIPATIISRCQRLDFRRISYASVINRLGQICATEGVMAGEPVLRSIARSSGGSLRDALNLLEQLIAMFGQNLELDAVQKMLGQAADLQARQVAAHMLRGNLSAGLKAINKASEDGIDLRQLQRELLEYLRCVLLMKSGAEDAVDLPKESIAEVKALAQQTTTEQALKAIRALNQPASRLDSNSTLALEMAVAECSMSPTMLSEPPIYRPTPLGKKNAWQKTEK